MDFRRAIGSSFADPADIRRFKACKAKGKTDRECFAVGDNGIGCWGHDTTANEPMCALPPDDMIARFGSIAGAKNAIVIVRRGPVTIACRLRDRMPWKRNIRNGAGIDLNPAACRVLGLKPPTRANVEWKWSNVR
jgi:PAS domain-containing protein